jgi:hypothetical protein
VHHTFHDGTHTFSGALDASTSCATLEASAQLDAAQSDQIDLALLAGITDQGDGCTEGATTTPFSVDLIAPEAATLANVTLNALPVTWTVAEEDASGPETTDAATEQPASGFFKRALEGTQGLFN